MDRIITSWNPAAAAMFGYSSEEIIGQSGTILMSEGYDDFEFIIKQVKMNSSVQFETTRLTKDCRVINVALTVSPIRDGRNRMNGISIVAKNITEHRKAEAALRRSEERFRILMQTLPVGVVVTDASLIIQVCNKQASEIFGHSESQLRGKKIFDQEWNAQKDDDSKFPNNNLGFEEPLTDILISIDHHSDNNRIWLLVNTFPEMDDRGNILEIVFTFQDVSTFKKAQYEAERSVSLLQATFESTGDGIVVVDKDGKIIQFNKKFIELWRIPEGVLFAAEPEKARRFILDQLVDPEAFINKNRQYLFQIPESETVDTLVFRDGRVYERVSKPQVIGGEVVGRVLSFRDITGRKKAEIAIQTQTNRQHLLYEVVKAAHTSLSLEATSKTVAQHFLEHKRWKRVSVCIYEPEIQQWKLLAEVGPPIINPKPSYSINEGVIGRAIRTGTTQNIKDVSMDPDYFEGDPAVLSELAVPIGGTNPIGALNIDSECIADFDEADVTLAESIAESLVLAFSNAHHYEEAQIEIEERKRVEEALRQSMERFEMVARASNDALWDVDLVHNIRWWSQSFYDLVGKRPEEGPDDSDQWEQRIHPDDIERIRGNYQRAIDQGAHQLRHEYRILGRDNSYRFVLSRSYILRSSVGKPVRVVGSMVDLTERKNLEDQLIQSQKRESLGRVAAGIAHDMNNMLGVILPTAEMLRNQNLPEENRQEMIEMIVATSSKAGEIVKQLMQYARKSPVTVMALDFNSLILSTKKMLDRLLGIQMEIVTELQPSLPFLEGDATQLQQVLVNLCLNARDAMHDHGKIRIITQTVDVGDVLASANEVRSGVFIRLTIVDKGEGIPKEFFPTIFDAFFTTKETGRGTGLGLAIVRSIVQNHKGFIQVESEIGEGTSMHIYFPISKKQPPNELFASPKISRTSGHVLVVDDEYYMRKMAQMTLTHFGYQVSIVSNGAEAIKVYKQSKDIDCVLIDVHLPGMDGIETLQVIREVNPDVKFLFTSGHLLSRQVEALKSLGIEEILYKPYSAEQLFTSIKKKLDS
ncbi:PAS domain S-box protein [bacterium]|nr:PAS domain S-box protein [bacterium]